MNRTMVAVLAVAIMLPGIIAGKAMATVGMETDVPAISMFTPNMEKCIYIDLFSNSEYRCCSVTHWDYGECVKLLPKLEPKRSENIGAKRRGVGQMNFQFDNGSTVMYTFHEKGISVASARADESMPEPVSYAVNMTVYKQLRDEVQALYDESPHSYVASFLEMIRYYDLEQIVVINSESYVQTFDPKSVYSKTFSDRIGLDFEDRYEGDKWYFFSNLRDIYLEEWVPEIVTDGKKGFADAVKDGTYWKTSVTLYLVNGERYQIMLSEEYMQISGTAMDEVVYYDLVARDTRAEEIMNLTLPPPPPRPDPDSYGHGPMGYGWEE